MKADDWESGIDMGALTLGKGRTPNSTDVRGRTGQQAVATKHFHLKGASTCRT